MTWKIASLEQQLELFADRTSTYAKRYPLGQTMNSNQLRLWLSSMAYVLLQAFRQNCLFQTSLAQATVGTIRLSLMKLGARITVSLRRILIAIAWDRINPLVLRLLMIFSLSLCVN